MSERAENSVMHRIGELIRTQDNRCTDAPMFVVQERRREYGYDQDRADEYAWIDTESDYCEATAEERAVLDRQDDEGDVPSRWEKVWYKDRWEFITACFTEQGCKDFIAADGHNHGELRIYAYGSYRNAEFRAVRDFLKNGKE